MRADAEQQSAEANRQAGEANKIAGKANERAGGLELKAQELERDNLQMREGVATLEKDAANSKRAYLELQERIKDRHLTTAQRQKLLEGLKGSPSGQIEIRCPIGNPEARNFAIELKDVFDTAGWKATLNDRVIMMPTPVGLKVWVHSEQPTEDGGGLVTGPAPIRTRSLTSAFKGASLNVEFQFNHGVPADDLVLVVGGKP